MRIEKYTRSFSISFDTIVRKAFNNYNYSKLLVVINLIIIYSFQSEFFTQLVIELKYTRLYLSFTWFMH